MEICVCSNACLSGFKYVQVRWLHLYPHLMCLQGMIFNTQLTLNLHASVSYSASLFCSDRICNIIAFPVVCAQPLHYTCNRNESVCIITWKQTTTQKRSHTIKVHKPSLAIQDVQEAWKTICEDLIQLQKRKFTSHIKPTILLTKVTPNIATCVSIPDTCWCNTIQEPVLSSTLQYFWILIRNINYCFMCLLFLYWE